MVSKIRITCLLAAGCCIAALASVQAAESTSSGSSGGSKSSSGTATQSRQSAMGMLGTIGSLVPGLITNVAPLVLLFGLGALMMPALGMGAMGLLRESRRSSNDQPSAAANLGALPSPFAQYARPLTTSPQEIYYFTKRSLPSLMSSVNTQGIMHGVHDLLERVVRAIDNADKRYN